MRTGRAHCDPPVRSPATLGRASGAVSPRPAGPARRIIYRRQRSAPFICTGRSGTGGEKGSAMTFRDQARIGSGRVRTGGGGGRRPQMAMGGVGGIIVVAVGLFFGLDLTGGGGSGSGLSGGGRAVTAQGYERAACETGADANADVDCRIEFTAHSLDQVWSEQLQQVGVQYQEPGVTLFRGGVTTGGCGSAGADVGPFYRPADDTAYFDSSFFQILEDRFGASSGPFAQEYVVAHECGRHIQTRPGGAGLANHQRA